LIYTFKIQAYLYRVEGRKNRKKVRRRWIASEKRNWERKGSKREVSKRKNIKTIKRG
jgi:hypothetical protein